MSPFIGISLNSSLIVKFFEIIISFLTLFSSFLELSSELNIELNFISLFIISLFFDTIFSLLIF